MSEKLSMMRASWIEIITGIGIILSLIFVATEIRANTRAVRGQTLQGITDQSITVSLALVSDHELRAAYSKALAGHVAELTPAEEDVLNYWYGAVMRVAENRFRQRALGTFDDASFAGGGATSYRIPFFRAYWTNRRATYPPDFAAYVDSTLIPLVKDSLPRIITR
jgi:hypothetical protein